MNKKTLRIITIISTVVLIISVFSLSFAAGNPSELKDKIGDGPEELDTFAGKVLSFLQAFGIIVSVVVLMVLGVKYMMGSAEEKAEYKKVFIPYIVGAILLFAATTIANVIYNVATNMTEK